MARHVSIEPHMVDGKLHLCVHVRQDDMLQFARNGLNLKAIFPKSPFKNPPTHEDVPFDSLERPILAPAGNYPFEVVEEASSFKMAQGQIDIDP